MPLGRGSSPLGRGITAGPGGVVPLARGFAEEPGGAMPLGRGITPLGRGIRPLARGKTAQRITKGTELISWRPLPSRTAILRT